MPSRTLEQELSMAHTHEFDCKICGAHLDSRQDLDKHNREKHTNQAQSGQSSSFGGSSSSNPSRNQG
jgi:hypothetical protein